MSSGAVESFRHEDGALQRLADFRDRASDLHAPGAWKDEARRPLSQECRGEIASVLRFREKLSSRVTAAVIEAIDAHAWDYHLWKAKTNTPAGEAFRAWHRTAIRKLNAFETWLARDPSPRPVRANYDGDVLEQLTWEREHVAKQVREFREWLEGVHDSRSYRRGRKPDFLRSDLVACIGTALWCAGVRPTISASGTYALVLDAVLSDVGVRSSDGASLIQTIRAACRDHSEWRQ